METNNPAKNLFHTVLPDTEGRPRVCLYITRQIDIRELRTHRYASEDIIPVLMDMETPIAIHNIYNPHTDGICPNKRYCGITGNSVISLLDKALHAHRTHEQVAPGGFDLMHPEWTGQDQGMSHANQTTCLREIFPKEGLEQCVPIGTITRPTDRIDGSGSTIDLVWATEGVRRMLHYFRVQHDITCDSDHLPIGTTIHISTPQRPDERIRNYAAMGIQKLRNSIKQNMPRASSLNT